jgi:hypothetical protein
MQVELCHEVSEKTSVWSVQLFNQEPFEAIKDVRRFSDHSQLATFQKIFHNSNLNPTSVQILIEWYPVAYLGGGGAIVPWPPLLADGKFF